MNNKKILEMFRNMTQDEWKKYIIEENKYIVENYTPMDDFEKEDFEIMKTEKEEDIKILDMRETLKAQEEFRKEYKKNKSVNIFSALKNKIAVL
ncbi:MAG: hypothetical protein Ta2D_08390 [Rickettsiales bacterium]|nr:MAG: hypothetical protein Ta2D_08390 [Rickettsiales bacterium]